MHSTVQKILCTTLLLSLGLLYVPHVFAVVGDIQLDVSAGGQIIGSALTTNKFTDAANTDYYLDPAAATTSLTVAGNVGIGTVGPESKLHVMFNSAGTITGFSDALIVENNTNAYLNLIGSTSGIKAITFGDPTAGVVDGQITYNAIATDMLDFRVAGNSVKMVIDSSGNVGIGTTGPGAKLDVSGSAVTGTASVVTGTQLAMESGSNNYINFRNSSDNATYQGLVFTDNNTGGYIVFKNYEGSGLNDGTHGDYMVLGTYTDFIFQTGASETINGKTEVMRIKQNGDVTANRFVGPLGCPSGWNSIAGGRLCHDPTVRGPSTIYVAIGVCAGLQAHVCEHNDMQQACGVINPYAGSAVTGWYGDHARIEPSGNTDDEFLTYNRNYCDVNNDGPGAEASTSLNYFCCQ